jgi:hypothetical protein
MAASADAGAAAAKHRDDHQFNHAVGTMLLELCDARHDFEA